MSTFESILKFYNFQDLTLLYIGQIIHDIEVNIWEKKIFPKSLEIKEAVRLIIKNSQDKEEIIEKSCKYFDSLYQESKSNIQIHLSLF